MAKSGYFHGRKSVWLYKNFSFAIIDCKSLQLSSSECRDNSNTDTDAVTDTVTDTVTQTVTATKANARTRNKLEDVQAGSQASSAPLSVADTDVDVDLVLWNTKIRQPAN